MKHQIIKLLCCSICAPLLLSGCATPRFGEITSVPKASQEAVSKIALTVPQAQKILKEALANPPAGRRRINADLAFIKQYVTKVQYRKHTKTGYYLMEFFTGKRKYISFYVRDKAQVRQVSDALWKLTQAK